jgi:hypothetical protein
MYEKPKALLRHEDGTEKYRDHKEILEAIPPRFQMPSNDVLEENHRDFISIQRRISKSLKRANVAGADKMPPCIHCSPAALYFCQETETQCWQFVKYAAR